jgi:enoyl-CoA hydratase/carnithine racemase
MSAVRLDVGDGVAVITLDRPEVRNAIDKPTADAIAQALDEIDARQDVSVGILTGAGPVFCAGMDLKAFSATGQRPAHDIRGGFGIVEKPPIKPMIAAVEGRALGGGLEIALACDLIVASESSLLGLPEVKRGLVAAAGGVLRLPRRIPAAIAKEMVLTGEPIDALRARELGLVNRIAPDGQALDVARELASAIARNAPLALSAAKYIVDMAQEWPLDEAFERQRPHTDRVRSSEDAAEGARAFIEKREPQWSGT